MLSFGPRGTNLKKLDQVAEILANFDIPKGAVSRSRAKARRGSAYENLLSGSLAATQQNLGFICYHKGEFEDVAKMLHEHASRLIEQAGDRTRAYYQLE